MVFRMGAKVEDEFKENLSIFENRKNCSERRTVINHDFESIAYEIEEFETKEPITIIYSKYFTFAM